MAQQITRDDFDRYNFLERLSRLVPETQTICYARNFFKDGEMLGGGAAIINYCKEYEIKNRSYIKALQQA